MICPILKRFATDPTAHTDCPFEAENLCSDTPNMIRCNWARWHMLDPLTGKPITPQQPQILSGCAVRAEIQREAQGDLFGE